MRNPFYLLFSLCILLSVNAIAQSDTEHKKDSLRQVIAHTEGTEKLKAFQHLGKLYMAEVQNEHVLDTLYAIYDEMDAEAARIGDLHYRAAIRNGRITALYNKRAYTELIEQAPAALDYLQEQAQWEFYYQLYATLCDTYRRVNKMEQALESAQTIYEQAKEQNHTGGMALMLRSISLIYNRQRRPIEAEKCLKEGIELIQDSVAHRNTQTSLYFHLGINYIAQRRYDDALRILNKSNEVNRLYEEESGTPQPTVWINQYQAYIHLYLQTNEHDLAQVYLDKLDSITNGSFKMYEERASVLYGKKEYDKALEMIEEAIKVSASPRQPKGVKLMILIQKGDAKQAYDLFVDVVTELDSARNAGFNAQLDEIRTQYEVDRHILEKERNRNYAYLALLGLGLALLALGIWIAYSRRLQEKNRNLVRRLREQDALDQQLEKERATTAQLRYQYEATPLSVETIQADPTDPLYDRLMVLLNEQIYTNPELNRAMLATRMNTNDRYLGELIKRYFNQTVADFITTYRLRHARQLLADPQSDYTVEAIALDSGFGSRTTFHQLFRKHYGLSPSEFRRLSLQEEENPTT